MCVFLFFSYFDANRCCDTKLILHVLKLASKLELLTALGITYFSFFLRFRHSLHAACSLTLSAIINTMVAFSPKQYYYYYYKYTTIVSIQSQKYTIHACASGATRLSGCYRRHRHSSFLDSLGCFFLPPPRSIACGWVDVCVCVLFSTTCSKSISKQFIICGETKPQRNGNATARDNNESVQRPHNEYPCFSGFTMSLLVAFLQKPRYAFHTGPASQNNVRKKYPRP